MTALTEVTDRTSVVFGPLRPHLSSYDSEAFVRPVQRFVWEPADVPDHPADGAGLAGRHLLILGSHVELRDQVAAGLREHGAQVLVSDAVEAAALPDGAAGVDGIVDLNLCGLHYAADPDGGHHVAGGPTWRQALARTTVAVQAVYETWTRDPRTWARALVVVTAMGGRMGYPAGSGGGGPVSQPLGGVWAGLAKGLPRELPNLAMKIVDVDQPELTDPHQVPAAAAQIVEALAAEYGRWDFFEVGRAGGRRVALAAVERPDPAPQLPLGVDDLVLVSGGARGVGFALVEHLARQRGCQVVVTGRHQLPTGAHRDLLLDDDAYERWRRERRATIRSAEQARAVRSELARAENDRAVLANLRRAEQQGLRVGYEACDVSNAEQVVALLRRLAPGPTVVIHNAGIDEPARFVGKSVDIVLRTVDVKVSGFAALVQGLASTQADRRPLRAFCNVGSLAGRMGGMIGQVDYAAGNEGLARLGFWGREHGLPVQTLCWPTWERLGVIANYDAAVRYVSTISPDEGARRWLAELEAGHTDEAVFLGQIGTALVPSQLRGFRLFAGHHDLSRLHALNAYLGEPERFVPFAELVSRHEFVVDEEPYLCGTRWAGRAVLPPSLALELLLAAADWVVPEGWPLQDVVAVEDLELNLDAAVPAASGRWCLHRQARGSGDAERWHVVTTVTNADGAVLARGTVVLSATAAPLCGTAKLRPDSFADVVQHEVDAAVGRGAAGDGPVVPAVATPTWHLERSRHTGQARRPGGADEAGRAWCRIVPVAPQQLWTRVFPPGQTIAVGAAEALFGAPGQGGPRRCWSRLELRPGSQQIDWLESHGSTVTGYALDGECRRPVLTAER